MKFFAAFSILMLAALAVPRDVEGAECRTPAEVSAAFESGSVCTVSSCLYGVITASDAAPTHPYPNGFAKAWLSGYRTIANILQSRHDKGPECNLTVHALETAGFPHPFNGAPYKLHVIDGCTLEKMGNFIAIPTVAEWVRMLMDTYQVEVPLPVFRNLADAGRDFTKVTACTGGTDPDTQAPIDALACVTGSQFPDHETCSCSSGFIDAYQKLRELSPYNANQTTAACFEQFKTLESTLPVLRAALWACQDVNPYNAFNGLGFNGAELTVSEFIVDNIGFYEMPPKAVSHIDLPDPVPCTSH